MRNNHEIDYKIYGEELQFVEIELDPGETVIGEPGGFMMMDDGIEMQTLFGDGSASSNQGGLLGRLMNAGKRVLVGANLFMTAFTNIGNGKRKVSFAAPYTGKIIPSTCSSWAAPSSPRKMLFYAPQKGSVSVLPSSAGWAPVSSAGKGSSWKNSTATDSPSYMPAAISSKRNCSPARSSR
jgi:hypothetical protein